MHAIVQKIESEHPDKKVLYLSAEQFMFQYVQSLRSDNTYDFKEMFRSADILLVDDVQFICGKKGLQTEFFHTFNNLISHLKDYIAELSSLAFDDALTSVHNKGAFDTNVHELQDLINSQKDDLEFAIAIFDCDNLKTINDRYGHKNGDIYLKTASNYICSIFRNSSVFRIGGDEFAVVMRNEDYANREELLKSFIRGMREINTLAQNKWNEVHLSVGLAAFEKEKDLLVDDVINRADKLMYEYKRNNKI